MSVNSTEDEYTVVSIYHETLYSNITCNNKIHLTKVLLNQKSQVNQDWEEAGEVFQVIDYF